MGSGNFYPQITGTKRAENGHRFGRLLMLSGVLLCFSFIKAIAQPVFTGGAAQTITVCQNAGPVSIDAFLTVNDASATSLTWDIAPLSLPPALGALSGLPASGSGGTGVMSSGVTYTPSTAGNDVFTIQVSDNNGLTAQTTIQVVITAPPTLTLTNTNPTICTGTGTVTLAYTGLTGIGPVDNTFSMGSVPWTVPNGISTITFDVQGAAGGGDNVVTSPVAGKGGRIQGTLAVTPGQTLNLFIGGQGQPGTTSTAAGGFNGGGNAYYYPGVGSGGAGGGASDIRVGGTALSNRVVVAGGGGGSGWDSPLGELAGGDGGGLVGAASAPNVDGSVGGGGTQSSGGAGATRLGWIPGMNGMLGIGGDGSTEGVSGGAGGGYYGGGGGVWNGGGGGSSYADPTMTSLVTHTPGYNFGDGAIAIHYNIAGTYSITWNPSIPVSVGLANVSGAPITPSPITFSVPTTLSAGSYSATLTITDGSCTSAYPFTLTVNQTPDVTPISSTAICNNATSSAMVFSGSVVPTTFNWVTDNPGIGVADSGTNTIPAFTAMNGGTGQVIANFTVTPTANGCTGTPATFQVAVNPTPTLSSATTASVCDSAQLTYVATTATAGTSFVWFRDSVAGIANAAATGPSAHPSEYLDNITSSPIAVNYVYTLTANTCVNTQTVTVTVNPTPVLSGATTHANCSADSFNYIFVPATTPGTVITWTRQSATGVTNPPIATPQTGDIHDVLVSGSGTTAPVPVPYLILLNYSGCTNTQYVYDTVYPSPTLSNSSLVGNPICSGQTFSFTPTSATAGATFQWNRLAVTGLPLSAFSGVGSVADMLMDTITTPIIVTYEYTPYFNTCRGTMADVTVMVKPTPALTSATSANACSNTSVDYTPASSVSGTTFTWLRTNVPGVVYPVGVANNGGIMDTLNDTTNHPILVPYVYTLTSPLGCPNTYTVTVNVNPIPRLTSPLTMAPICDSLVPNYMPASNVNIATFMWKRTYAPGIANPTNSGTGRPNEHLINSTNVDVTAAYVYTVSVNGCPGNPVTVDVIVHPQPKLSPPLSAVVCSGQPLTYNPSSYVAGTTYQWNRYTVKGINNGVTGQGTGGVSETLNNSTDAPIQVIYGYRLTANGCPNLDTQNVVVTVNNLPSGDNPSRIEISGNGMSLCSATNFVTFGAGGAPESGVSYAWSASNATIWAESSNTQYAYVNFPNPGNAKISMTATVNATGCKVTNTSSIDVGTSSADQIKVVYIGGQFVALANDVDSYQWGYDDVNNLQSVSIDGAVNQNYYEPNADVTGRRYWVMTVHNGCTQKSFYNAPQGPVAHRTGSPEMRIYPNPVNSDLTVELFNLEGGNLRFEITNMLGQSMIVANSSDLKTVISAASLAPGAYLIDCFDNGSKIATARFIKK